MNFGQEKIPNTFEYEGETYQSVKSATACCDGCAFDVDEGPCFGEDFPPCVVYTNAGPHRVIFVKVA